MHPAQDTSAWLILLESWESQLYRGVSQFLRRKFCEKWKLAVWKELLKHFDVRYSILTDWVLLHKVNVRWNASCARYQCMINVARKLRIAALSWCDSFAYLLTDLSKRYQNWLRLYNWIIRSLWYKMPITIVSIVFPLMIPMTVVRDPHASTKQNAQEPHREGPSMF